MGKIKKILENELVGGTQSNDVYPVTSVKAVYDENNERLDHILNRRGTVNISTNYNSDHTAEVLTLSQAIAKVPASDRVLGFSGAFLSSNGWETYRFAGDSVTEWLDVTKWYRTEGKYHNLGLIHVDVPTDSITIGDSYQEDGFTVCNITLPALGTTKVLDISTGKYIPVDTDLGGTYVCPYNYGVLAFVSGDYIPLTIIAISIGSDNSKYNYRKIYNKYKGCNIVPFLTIIKGKIKENLLYNQASLERDHNALKEKFTTYSPLTSVPPVLKKSITSAEITISSKKTDDKGDYVEVTFPINASLDADIIDPLYGHYNDLLSGNTFRVPYNRGVLAFASYSNERKVISYSLSDQDNSEFAIHRVLSTYSKYNLYPLLFVRGGILVQNNLVTVSHLEKLMQNNLAGVQFVNFISTEELDIIEDANNPDYINISTSRQLGLGVLSASPAFSQNINITDIRVFKHRGLVALVLGGGPPQIVTGSYSSLAPKDDKISTVFTKYADRLIVPLLVIDDGTVTRNYMETPYSPAYNTYFVYSPMYQAASVIQSAVKEVEIITTNGKPVSNYAISSIRNGDGDNSKWTITFAIVNADDLKGFITIGNKSNETQVGEQEYNVSVSNIQVPTIKSIRVVVDWSKVPVLGTNYMSYNRRICTILSNNSYSKELEASSHPYIVVDAAGNGDYTSLQDAIDNAGDSKSNPKTIVVMPGTYVMPAYDSTTRYKGSNRYLSIIGTDRNSCIIRNDNGYYCVSPYVDNGVLKMQGQIYIANLTIISTDDNFDPPVGDNAPSDGKPDNWHRAYCIHFDFGADADTICEVNNCILKNDHYANIGCGNKGTLRLVNCIMETEMYNPNLVKGCVYSHDSNNNRTYNLEIINCILTSSHTPITVANAYNRPMNMLFINNVATNLSGDKKLSYNSTYHTFDGRCFGNNFATV